MISLFYTIVFVASVGASAFQLRQARVAAERPPQDVVDILGNLSTSLGDNRVAEIESVFAAQNGSVVAIVVTHQVLCQADNFLVHAKRNMPHRKIVQFSLDAGAQSWCTEHSGKRNTLTCINLTGWIEHTEGVSGFNGEGRSLYVQFVWAKPTLLHIAARSSSAGVLMLDVDVVLRAGAMGDLVDWIEANKRPSTTIVVGAGINTGSVYADSGSTGLINEWLNLAATFFSWTADQGAFQHLVSDRHLEPFVQTIPVDVFGVSGDHKNGEYGHHYCGPSEGGKIANEIAANEWAPEDEACASKTSGNY